MKNSNSERSIILASGSPRRQQFLRQLGVTFEVITADIDETPLHNERPIPLVKRLAESKAQAVMQRLAQAEQRAALIIAADTVVALGEQILGKPLDAADAERMLLKLRSQPHFVHSAVSVLAADLDKTETYEQKTIVNSTQVHMRAYSEAEIADYIASGDPLDKAGAYAIQNRAFRPVEAMSGCASAVIGLPLQDLRDLLAQFDVILTRDIPSLCALHTDFGCCQLAGNGQKQK